MFKLPHSRSAKLLHVLLQVVRDRETSQERGLKAIICIKYIQDCQYLQDWSVNFFISSSFFLKSAGKWNTLAEKLERSWMQVR